MRDPNETYIGGAKNGFHTTHWSIIYAARTENEHRQKEIISDITFRYWRPVYCYLRRKGYHDSTAKDLTQGFFCDIVLSRELIQHADKSKGRFRTLLLTALERYVVSIHRRKSRQKRQPKAGIHQLEADELSNLVESNQEMKPEDAFYYTWAADLLDCVLAEVRDEYCCTGRTTLWEVFRLKVLAPIIDNVEAPSYTEICDKCGLQDESKASNMVITVKRRFRAILKRHLRDLVQSDSEVEEELEEIFTILSGSKYN
jgi:DNA-directed RNA polymerase specialized sigma24 family protein